MLPSRTMLVSRRLLSGHSTTTKASIPTLRRQAGNLVPRRLATTSTTTPPLGNEAQDIAKPAYKKPFWRRRPVITACIATPFIVTASLGVVLLGLMAYDASTYADKHVDNVPVDPLALQPTRGGKKNLKIAKVLVDDHDRHSHAHHHQTTQGPHAHPSVDSPEQSGFEGCQNQKPRLVIVGGGWGAVGILKKLDPNKWHVTLVAPENYFLFHPLLPSATVGTVEVRSLVEPLRKIIARVSGHFLQAKAVDLDMSERLLEVEGAPGTENFYVPYDKLVIACGSVNATHGVQGLNNCLQLKTVSDAQAIRRRVMNNLEAAALPSMDEADREKLLSFVICGGGPTGVEFASELYDMINEDVMGYMPALLREKIKVHIIQSRDHILNTYAESISDYAEKKFARNEINTILNARVKEVTPDKVVYTVKNKDGTSTEQEVVSGLTLWSTGIAMNPFTEQVASLLPNQYHKKALEVDSQLRVKGAPLGTVYALGDCSTIETSLVDYLLQLVKETDANGDGLIDNEEFDEMIKIINRKFPTAKVHNEKIRDVFDQYSDKNTGVLGMNELANMFRDISRKMTALPATAQVANQQGAYLGHKFSKIIEAHKTAELNHVDDDPDEILFKPFEYKHMGSLAYIGNAAVLDFGNGYNFSGGLVAMSWRSIYWSEQVSFRSRMLLMADWVKRGIWGRDLSKF